MVELLPLKSGPIGPQAEKLKSNLPCVGQSGTSSVQPNPVQRRLPRPPLPRKATARLRRSFLFLKDGSAGFGRKAGLIADRALAVHDGYHEGEPGWTGRREPH